MNYHRITGSVITSVVGVVLLVLLGDVSGITVAQFVKVMAEMDARSMLVAAFAMAVPVLIASVKWRGVLYRVMGPSNHTPNFSFLVHFSALAGVLGQVMTPYAAGPAVRGIAVRRAGHGGFLMGASTSVYEQFFDAWASLVFAGAGILLLMAGASDPIVAVGHALAAVLGAVSLQYLFVRPHPENLLDRLLDRLPGPFRRLREFRRTPESAALFEKSFVSRLYWLSALRFWVLGFLVIAIAGRFGQDWTVIGMLHAFAAVQITRFAAFTPGNLGLAEWGWTAVLALSGWSLAAAALFALVFRVVGLAFTFVIYLAAALWYVLSQPKYNGAEPS